MITKRCALVSTLAGTLFLLLFAAACGAPATQPQAPGDEYDLAPATEAPAATGIPGNDYYPEAPAAQGPALPDMQLNPSSGGRHPHPTPSAHDTFFEDYGVNPSIDTEDDNLSTFALDVDTGSYTIMRSYVSQGSFPPPDSVRVEEYVNYFEQGYPNPPRHQAFGLYMNGGPSPFTQTDHYDMLRVGIQGYAVPPEEREPAALTFVIDVSGSMSMDNRLELVKRSLELLVEQMRPDDSVSIVVYGTDARVVLEPTRASDQGRIMHAINRLHPEGVTNAEAGLRLGYSMALEGFNGHGINRVILCSDGVANTGNTDPDVILEEVRGYVEEGVTLTTVGFGMDNYNDTLMEQLADDGNGFYAYVDDLDEAQRLFIDNLTGTLQTIALNAKVQVDFNPHNVLRYRLVGFENRAVADEDFRDNKVDAGEIGAGHSVTALYEIKLAHEAHGRIATVNLRWEDPETHQVTELSRDFDTAEMAGDFYEADPYFQRAVIVAEYAEILKHSYWSDGSLRPVYEEARRVEHLLYREDDMSEFLDLVRDAMRLDGPYE